MLNFISRLARFPFTTHQPVTIKFSSQPPVRQNNLCNFINVSNLFLLLLFPFPSLIMWPIWERNLPNKRLLTQCTLRAWRQFRDKTKPTIYNLANWSSANLANNCTFDRRWQIFTELWAKLFWANKEFKKDKWMIKIQSQFFRAGFESRLTLSQD